MERRVVQEIQALHDLADTVWAAETLTEVLQAATDRVANLLGADRVSLITFDMPQRRVEHFVRGGGGSDRIVATVTFEELLGGLSGWVLAHGQAAVSPGGAPDTRETPEAQKRRLETNCGGILVVPLKHRDQLLGTMTAINLPHQPDFSEHDVELMSLFANYCAMVTDNARVLLDLRKAKEEAEASNRAKSEFLAIMSHELRTPLNAIIGFSHLLGLSSLDESQKDYTRAISTGGETLLTIVNNILDLARIEAGELTIEQQAFSVTACVNNALAGVTKLIDGRPLAVTSIVAPELAGYYLGDELRIRQVLNHLLDNAVKFTAGGAVTVTVLAARDRVQFEVSDTGMGIPPEKFDRLFRAFTQLDGSSTRRHGGTGLGLALCRHLVRLMGGEISLESTLGQGSRFRFELPLRKAEVETPSASPTKLKVLLVEDNLLSQVVVSKMIESLGHSVEVVEDGQSAIERCAVSSYSVVFMDLSMPGMDGFETTRRIRQAEHLRSGGPARQTIIALTAHTLSGDRERCLAAGMDAFISKPLSLDALKTHLSLL